MIKIHQFRLKYSKIEALIKASYKWSKVVLALGMKKLFITFLVLNSDKFPLIDNFLDLAKFLLFNFANLYNILIFSFINFIINLLLLLLLLTLLTINILWIVSILFLLAISILLMANNLLLLSI